MIDVSDKIGGIAYPVQHPDRIHEIRKRRETIKRDESNERRRDGKKKKKPTGDHRLDTRV